MADKKRYTQVNDSIKPRARTGTMARSTAKAKSKGGWSPKGLSPAERKLYNKYNKEFGKASPTWADGSPRNPMPEIREQYRKSK